MLPTALHGFRAHALDGAMLYFEPRTGTHVRVETAATAHLRRTAPRVAMFGITNACNLRCAFCSRDATRPSAWTVATAAAALQGLAAAGTLEVAYGGGEPLTFAGFDELVAELSRTTPLAQHVTTNGTLITRERWRGLAGRLGVVRLSIYDDPRWRTAATVLSAAAQRWGANLLVDDAALGGLPALLAELAVRGAEDVSILTCVGEPARALSAAGARRLAALLADAPLPARLSVCAGDRVPVPRLPTGLAPAGDCGAGLDFVTITSDQRVLACSFHDAAGAGHAGRTADEILTAWRTHQPALAAPSPRSGCARRVPLAVAAVPAPPVAIWRGFAGNNSGECVMVARFETSDAAAAYLAELLPGWVPDQPIGAAWLSLFAEARLPTPALTTDGTPYNAMPRELVAIGRSVIALGHDADDQFFDLRGLAWGRGAEVLPGGIHVHESLWLLAAIGARDADDAAALLERAHAQGHRGWRHGARVLFALSLDASSLVELGAYLRELAGERPLSAEVYSDELADAAVVAVLQRLGTELPRHGRLAVRFVEQDADKRAAEFARALHGHPCTVAGGIVLFDAVARPQRLAVLGARHGGYVTRLGGEVVRIGATLWIDEPPPQKGRKAAAKPLPLEAIEAAVRAIPGLTNLEIEPYRTRYVGVRGLTSTPAVALTRLGALADDLQLRISPSINDIDTLAWSVRRMLADLDG